MITAHWVSLLIVEPCGFPLWPAPVMISQNFLMLALFGDFYRKSYLMKKPPTTATTTTTAKAVAAGAKKEINDSNNNISNNNNSSSDVDDAKRTSVAATVDGTSGQNGLTKRH